MKKIAKILYLGIVLFSIKLNAQHHSKMIVEVDNKNHTISVKQELTFYNQTNDTIKSIVLNDWNNAYSDKNTPLGKRFSDEFVRSFHLATNKERGITTIALISDENQSDLTWNRPDNYPDLVEIQLKNPIFPNQKIKINLNYTLQIPDDKFTRYGYNSKDEMVLKNWFLTPSSYINHQFVKYSNLNIDDVSNAIFNIDLQINSKENSNFVSDLNLISKNENSATFSGSNQLNNNLYIQQKNNFESFKNDKVEVVTNISSTKVNDIQKALIVDKIVNFVSENLGQTSQNKIVVSQTDYDQNPFYGLNQLPAFISPFRNDFLFELKFLKTYLNNYLKNSMRLDTRKDNWVFDAIQVYYMMKYINENYPNMKFMGSIAKFKLVKGYNMVSMDFNEQYSYFYMLMARKNIDQPLGDPKSTLIKYNEKIASKYRAGLSFRYLADYIGAENLSKTIADFISFSDKHEASVSDFETILKKNTSKNVDWFFNSVINSRQLIDYKFKNVAKTENQVSFSITDKTNANVPVSVYGIKDKNVVFKQWIDAVKSDSIYTFNRNSADKLVINYNNEIPEYNRRNNWKSLKSFPVFNKPLKFIFLKDLEDPRYNQVLYEPTLEYNYYDGFIAGMSFFNKTILDKPFYFDISPSIGLKSRSLSGSFSFALNQNIREGSLYNIKYGFSGNTFHYAPDASYQKMNPYVVMRFREDDYRDNHRKTLMFREVYVNTEPTNYKTTTQLGTYAVFNARFNNVRTEITRHFGYANDLQLASNFGKVATEVSFRRLFDDNRQVNLRLYAGMFLYNNSNSINYNFALDRPSDYLFDYNYLGRSESTGLYSQQYIQAEGGFKSKFVNQTSNQWLTAANGSFNVWNWIEIYGDLGLLKNKQQTPQFYYDSGVRLNLVTDYFELYFPVQSTNGFEITQPHYAEKVRFILAFSPQSLIGLFTRKWF